jgi:P-type conjugative transfer protein TrbG
MRILIVCTLAVILSSCASDGFIAQKFGYTPDKYIPKDKVQDYIDSHYDAKDLKISKTIYTTKEIPVSSNAVMTSFGMTQNTNIINAYNNYMNQEENTIVQSDGYTTYPYDPYSRPILKCSIGRVCTIQLQAGETIQGKPSLGDSLHWNMDVGTHGSADNSSQMLLLKPIVVKNDLQNGSVKYFSTNLIIPTDKRVYNIGLLETPPNQNTTIMNFYYPQETSDKLTQQVADLKSHKSSTNQDQQDISYTTNVNMNDINPEKYNITVKSENTPLWKPTTVFDNGKQTFIKMPDNIDSYQLPAVWVQRQNGEKELSNSNTFHKPYFVIQGIYKTIYLYDGSGKNTQSVEITRD